MPRAVHQIFNYIEKNPNQAVFRVTISFLEIYMEHITDLLVSSAGGLSSSQSGANRSASTLRGSSSANLGQQAG